MGAGKASSESAWPDTEEPPQRDNRQLCELSNGGARIRLGADLRYGVTSLIRRFLDCRIKIWTNNKAAAELIMAGDVVRI